MYKRYLFCFSLFLTFIQFSIGQITYKPEQLDSLLNIEKRPIFVFLYADWCTYCDRMKQKSLAKKYVSEVLNDNYWFVSFDGGTKKDIQFLGKNYSYMLTGLNSSTHQLAEKLGQIDGKLFYPTSVILNGDGIINWQYCGFLPARKLKEVLLSN
jgi:thioredoxin-related protein